MTENKSRQMKPSGVPWLGDIPEGWDTLFLVQLAAQVKNRNSDLAETNLLSLSYGKIKRKDIDSPDGLLPASFDGYNIIEKGDVVLRLTDLQNDQTSLRVGRSEERGIITSAYTTVHPRNADFAPYLFYALNAFDLAKGFYGMGSGVRQGLNWSEVKRLRVPFPPLPEQRAIADFLDEKCAAIDAIVEEAKSGIEEYAKWKQSVVFQAVTKGLDPHAKMKDSGVEWIGDIPEKWEVMPIKHIVNLLAGFAFKSEEFEMSEGVRLLRGINVGVNGLRWDECVFWNKPVGEELAGYQIHKGDLIVGLDRPWISEGTRVCFATDDDLPCLLVQRVCRIRSLGKTDLRIIKHWLASNAFEQALSCETTGISVPHISPRQILEFRIAFPPLPEQRAIADYLDEKCSAIDALIEEKKQLIEDLGVYKKSLIYETVTGKRKIA